MADSAQDRHTEKADDQAKAKAKEKGNQAGSGKGFGLSNFLMFLFGSSGLLLIGLAINYHTKGGHDSVKLALFWGVIGYALFGVGLYFAYHEYVVKPARAADQITQRFPAAVESVLGTPKRDMNAVFWFALGKSIYPAHVALFLRFVNNGPPAMIEFYRIAALNHKGRWVTLTRIPNMGGGLDTFYWIYDGKFNEAGRLEMTCIDPQLIDYVIPAHHVIRGWAFFEVPEDIDIERGAKLRIQIKDVTGNESIQEVRAEEGGCATAHWRFTWSQEKTDLSNRYKKYWSESPDSESPN
jgi:hypothetical protein